MELKKIIEAVLFAADKPLSTREITRLVKKGLALQAGAEEGEAVGAIKVKEAEVEMVLGEMKIDLQDRAVILQEIAEGWRLGTAPEYASWVRALCQESGRPRQMRLSQAALETLAVIAYRQPLSRSEVEAIRGVGVGGVLETLLERGAIKVAGRAEVPGRPLLYETTPIFLEHFGLRSLDELPNVEELRRVKLPESTEQNQQPDLIHEEAEATETAS